MCENSHFKSSPQWKLKSPSCVLPWGLKSPGHRPAQYSPGEELGAQSGASQRVGHKGHVELSPAHSSSGHRTLEKQVLQAVTIPAQQIGYRKVALLLTGVFCQGHKDTRDCRITSEITLISGHHIYTDCLWINSYKNPWWSQAAFSAGYKFQGPIRQAPAISHFSSPKTPGGSDHISQTLPSTFFFF